MTMAPEHLNNSIQYSRFYQKCAKERKERKEREKMEGREGNRKKRLGVRRTRKGVVLTLIRSDAFANDSTDAPSEARAFV